MAPLHRCPSGGSEACAASPADMACTFAFSAILVRMASLFVEQGSATRTTIPHFHIPPASMTVFDVIGISFFMVFYEKLIAPLYTEITNKVPNRSSDLKRMGIVLAFAIAAMITAGLIELQRRNQALQGGKELSSLGILWQIPQYALIGIAEAFFYVGQIDYFSSQLPDEWKSRGIGPCMALFMQLDTYSGNDNHNRGWKPWMGTTESK
ncbi:putative protein NRT1/ PTR FAMILY 7.3 [Cocos nucifera]|uniref:Uncharacterized protein n=1 Tax=Cocos nucifera TaxID=13894 RepID=A0A8K0IET9_COCNU|nr:putative protein NRT1/ PTR FAMILY 7.3 [Cocos nucifera]